MKMAITTWQLMAATCCLLLKSGPVLSETLTGQPGQTPSGSDGSIGGPNYPSPYTPALDYARRTYSLLGPYASNTDLAATHSNAETAPAEVGNFPTSEFDNVDQQQQPKVYQSKVGRIIGPARQASTMQASTTNAGDLNMAAGHHHGHHHHGKYYEYREVPKKKTWKFGYKRGNHKHHIERHEHGKAGKHPHFKSKVKWADKKSKGKGIHLWDYNHHDKKHYHHHHGK